MKIAPLSEQDKRRYRFDAANDIEPYRTTAERIAAKYGAEFTHPIVDDIAHAIEDAHNTGIKRAQAKAL